MISRKDRKGRKVGDGTTNGREWEWKLEIGNLKLG